MKPLSITALLLLLASAGLAQSTEQPPAVEVPVTSQPGPQATPPEESKDDDTADTTVQVNWVGIGFQGVSVDTESGKFDEYRDIPSEPVLPSFRIAGSGAWAFDLTGMNVSRSDQRYILDLDNELFAVTAVYDQIPHRFGPGRTLEQFTSRGTLEISDALQRTFQESTEKQFAAARAGVNFSFLNNLVSPSLAVTSPIDTELLRKRGLVELRLMNWSPADVRVTYNAESRSGTRGAGSSFGFGNVVETPEPINYMTRNVGISGETTLGNALIRGALNVNDFKNSVSSYTFDNPFRITDSTDPSAYQAPGSASVNGPAVGRLSLPPSNNALSGGFGLVYKLPANSRLNIDLGLGRWRQNEDLIPYTTNTAIITPFNASDVSTLPVQKFNGKINTNTQTLAFTSRPIRNLSLRAQYRRYDMENDSPRIEFPGYVRFDGVFEDVPRISVPYSVKNERAEVTGSYDFRLVTLEGGYRNEKVHRTFRETEQTDENVFNIAADVRPLSWIVLRTSYEFGRRDFDHYDAEEGEHASFLEPGPATNLPLLRRFDQAEKDLSRIVSMLQLTPFGGNFSVSMNYLRNLDDYDQTDYGLVRFQNDSLGIEADYSPSDRWSTYGFYAWEDNSGFQRGRQSGATPSTNPLDDWTADNTDKVTTLGLGGTVGVIPDKADVRLLGRYQKVNGSADLFSPPGGTPNVAVSIPVLDDTRLWTVSAELAYRLTDVIEMAIGGWIEDYQIRDTSSTGLRNYLPGSFFLATLDGDYRGNVTYLRATYRW